VKIVQAIQRTVGLEYAIAHYHINMKSPDIFFFSDAHFGHKLMVTTRNFSTIEEHDETLITNFNSVVKEGDTTYFLGDFAWQDHGKYLYRLNGNFHFIRGNHDKGLKQIMENKPTKVLSFTEGYLDIFIDKQPITLCHFPMARWEKSHYGAWHLFGHCHSKWCPEQGKIMNATVDSTGLKPVSFNEVAEYMKGRNDNPDLVRRKTVL